MNKPEAAIEAVFNKSGLFFFPKESFKDPKNFNKIGVTIEAAVSSEAKIIDIDFMVSVKGRRGTVVSFTDWTVIEREGQKILQFVAWAQLPQAHAKAPDETYFCSFTDLCWWVGSEQVDPVGRPTAETKINHGFAQADLGWALPSRFVDSLVDSLGKMNDFMLSGTLEEAVLYGPMFQAKGVKDGV